MTNEGKQGLPDAPSQGDSFSIENAFQQNVPRTAVGLGSVGRRTGWGGWGGAGLQPSAPLFPACERRWPFRVGRGWRAGYSIHSPRLSFKCRILYWALPELIQARRKPSHLWKLRALHAGLPYGSYQYPLSVRALYQVFGQIHLFAFMFSGNPPHPSRFSILFPAGC